MFRSKWLFLVIFLISLTSAFACQYHSLSTKEVYHTHYFTREDIDIGPDYPLTINDFEYVDDEIRLGSFNVYNNANATIVFNIKYKTTISEVEFINNGNVIRPNSQISFRRILPLKNDVIDEESINIDIPGLYKAYITEEVTYKVCDKCDGSDCLDDGDKCWVNDECGSGFCVLGICSTSELCYNNDCKCLYDEVQCDDNKRCGEKGILQTGNITNCSKYQCESHRVDENNVCLPTDQEIARAEFRRKVQRFFLFIILIGAVSVFYKFYLKLLKSKIYDFEKKEFSSSEYKKNNNKLIIWLILSILYPIGFYKFCNILKKYKKEYSKIQEINKQSLNKAINDSSNLLRDLKHKKNNIKIIYNLMECISINNTKLKECGRISDDKKQSIKGLCYELEDLNSNLEKEVEKNKKNFYKKIKNDIEFLLTIKELESEYKDKLERLKKVLPNIKNFINHEQYIDLSNKLDQINNIIISLENKEELKKIIKQVKRNIDDIKSTEWSSKTYFSIKKNIEKFNNDVKPILKDDILIKNIISASKKEYEKSIKELNNELEKYLKRFVDSISFEIERYLDDLKKEVWSEEIDNKYDTKIKGLYKKLEDVEKIDKERHEEVIKEIEKIKTKLNELLNKFIGDKKQDCENEYDNKFSEYLVYKDKKLKQNKLDNVINKLTNLSVNNSNYYPNLEESKEKAIKDIEKVKEDLENYNKEFIKEEKKKFKELFKIKGSSKTRNYELSDEQKEAIIKDDEYNLVIAAAGSGKTEVLTSRIKYLCSNNRFDKVNPNQILALAFTNDAVEVMKKRLPKEFEKQIMTFHKLGQKIVNKPVLGDNHNYNRIREEIIKDILMKFYNKDFNLIIDYLGFFALKKCDSATFAEKEDFFKKQLRNYDLITIDKGIKVKSQGERQIVNFFFSHRLNNKDIELLYEQPALWMKYINKDRQERIPKPDFYFKDLDIYWEHWAIDKDGKAPSNFINYISDMKEKQKKFKQNPDKTFIETTYGESIKSQEFNNIIKNKFLSALNRKYPKEQWNLEPIPYKELVDKVWNKSKKGWYEGKRALETLHKNISSFINNAKVYRNTPDKIHKSIQKMELYDISISFTKIANQVYKEYEEELKSRKVIDFNDMINEAVDILNNNKYPLGFKPKHILIDEFQDISKQRFELVNAIRKYNPNSHLFCVGDDWQSIMSFAGSDVSYFIKFNDIVKDYVEKTKLTYNYRCGENIINLGNNIIELNLHKDKNSQISKEVLCSDENKGKGEISIIYYNDRHNNRTIYDYLLKLIEGLKDKDVPKKEILVLCRYDLNNENNIPNDILNKINNCARVKTIHKSKGDEAEYVFLLNIERGAFGFPSEMENSYLFKYARGQEFVDKDAEERRLFYVAVTRAKKRLYLFSSNSFMSSFIDELKKKNLNYINETNYIEINTERQLKL